MLSCVLTSVVVENLLNVKIQQAYLGKQTRHCGCHMIEMIACLMSNITTQCTKRQIRSNKKNFLVLGFILS